MKKIPWYAIRKDTLILNFSLIFGTFLLGSLMFNIMEFAMLVDGDEYVYFPLGTIFVIAAYFFICLFAGWQDEAQVFGLSMAMGETRKRFFAVYALQNYLLRLVSWAAINLCHVAEKALTHAVARGLGVSFVSEELFEGLFCWQTYLLVPLLFTAFTLFIGGIGLRMGTNTRWFVMALYLLVLFVFNWVSRTSDYTLLLEIKAWMLFAAAVALILVLVGVAACLMRKQQVNL